MMDSRGENAPQTDAEPPTDHNDETDGRQGHIPSSGLARILHDLDIEEYDRKTEQRRVRREGGRR